MSQPARFMAELTALPSQKECEYRSSCRGQRWYDSGVEFIYFENLLGDAPGRWCCPKCTSYLEQKATTVRRPDDEVGSIPAAGVKALGKEPALGKTT